MGLSMRAPFPYFGGKSKIAPVVWERFGHNVARLIDPFCGSLAVPLAAPYPIAKRIFNDADALLINAWRAIQAAPDEVLRWAARPIAELELRAQHAAMRTAYPELAQRIAADRDYYHAEWGGIWIWGMSNSLGNHWWLEQYPRAIPQRTSFKGISSWRAAGTASAQIQALSVYLAGCILPCGDWSRVMTDAALFYRATTTNQTAVFLDPPYQHDGRAVQVYGAFDDPNLMGAVIDWCLAYGDDPRLRIALCRYDTCTALDAAGWGGYTWAAPGGYGNQNAQGNDNRHREIIYFSPHCLNNRQLKLWGD